MKTNQTAETETETLTIKVPKGTRERLKSVARFLGRTEAEVRGWLFLKPQYSVTYTMQHLWEMSRHSERSVSPNAGERERLAYEAAKYCGSDWEKFGQMAAVAEMTWPK